MRINSFYVFTFINIRQIMKLISYFVTALHNNSINWLKNNRNPWESVVAKWTETFEVRKNSKYQTLREFIDDWSIMNDLRSKHLVAIFIHYLL